MPPDDGAFESYLPPRLANAANGALGGLPAAALSGGEAARRLGEAARSGKVGSDEAAAAWRAWRRRLDLNATTSELGLVRLKQAEAAHARLAAFETCFDVSRAIPGCRDFVCITDERAHGSREVVSQKPRPEPYAAGRFTGARAHASLLTCSCAHVCLLESFAAMPALSAGRPLLYCGSSKAKHVVAMGPPSRKGRRGGRRR